MQCEFLFCISIFKDKKLVQDSAYHLPNHPYGFIYMRHISKPSFTLSLNSCQPLFAERMHLLVDLRTAALTECVSITFLYFFILLCLLGVIFIFFFNKTVSNNLYCSTTHTEETEHWNHDRVHQPEFSSNCIPWTCTYSVGAPGTFGDCLAKLPAPAVCQGRRLWERAAEGRLWGRAAEWRPPARGGEGALAGDP